MNEMQPVKCRVHPHHPKNLVGPHDVKVGITRMPASLHNWDKKNPPRFCMEQPEPETNFTLLTIVYGKPGIPLPHALRDLEFHKANMWKVRPQKCPADQPKEVQKAWEDMKPSHFVISIKGRYIKQLNHPLPTGQWEGTVQEHEHGIVVFHLQACTLRLTGTETERTILTPGDEGFDIPTELS